MPQPPIFRSRGARNLLLALFFALAFAPSLYGAVTMDYARDVFIALRLLEGQEFPLTGPLLNGAAVHLGPVWYYVLALVLGACGKNWLATTLVVGLLAALQVPLAYLAGKALHGRAMGLLWAALLIVPGWGLFNTLLPSHPQLAPALMIAFCLCAIRYARRPRSRYLYGMAACYTLAVHAHPAALGLTWIGAGICAHALWNRQCRWRQLAIAMLIAIAPLLPAVWSDATHGFNDFGNASNYIGHTGFLDNLAQTGNLVIACVDHGLRYWLKTMLGWPRAAVAGALACARLLWLAALLGWIVLACRPATRTLVLAASFTALSCMATIAMMRDVTPYYMAVPACVLLAGLLALGLSGLGRSGAASAAYAAVFAGAVVLAGCADVGAGRFQQRGAWPFGWYPLADIKHRQTAHAPMLLMPAYAMDGGGRFLCDEPPSSLHGIYGTHAVMNYAIEMRLACARADILAGGADADRRHWLGLSRAVFAQLGVEPQRRLGPLGVVAAIPWPPGKAAAQHATPIYPPYWPPPVDSKEYRMKVRLAAGEYLVVSNTLNAPDGQKADVLHGSRLLAAKARDAISSVYACDDCGPGGDDVDLTLFNVNLAAVDVVTFRAPEKPVR